MKNQRSFSLEFKRQAVEELLSGESRPAQLCRRYDISSSLLYHWKKQYSRGKFNNEPTEEAALRVIGGHHTYFSLVWILQDILYVYDKILQE
jgi:transposase-like protein